MKIILLSGLLTSIPVLADDVEIFFNSSAGGAGDPLVMFSLDYRPNTTSSVVCNFSSDVSECGWDDPADTSDDDFYTAFYAEFTAADKADGKISFLEQLRAALRYVLNRPQILGNVRVGLMLNHAHVNNCENDESKSGCSNGGYITMGFTKTGGTDNGEQILDRKLGAIPDPGTGGDAHSNQGKELYYELYQYLTGGEIYNGHVGRSDYGDDCGDDNLDDAGTLTCSRGDDYDLPAAASPYDRVSWDTAIESGGNYVSPFTDTSLECSGVYALNFMFGVSNQDDDSDSAITSDLTGIDLSGRNNKFSTVIDWMYRSASGPRDLSDLEGDQNVTSYFLFKGNVQNTMDGYAIAGGTGQAIEVTDDPKAMVDSLISAFVEILRQNATFQAPAVTVNSYTRLTHRDELFYALFSPELVQNWPGNLKKYRLGTRATDTDGDGVDDTVTTRVEDKNSNQAVDPINGTFKPTACSFWTDCSLDREGADGIADPDGDIVHWGGAAEEIEDDGTRVIFTDDGTSMVDLDASHVTHAQLGISTDTKNNAASPCIDADGDGDTECVDMDGDGDVKSDDHDQLRTDLLAHLHEQTLGDPIHARPAVIEYDADLSNQGANPDLVVALATNEGTFHLFNAATGTEYSAYMPSELLPLIKQINGPFDPTGTDSTRFGIYGLDGSPVIRVHDADGDGVLNDGGDIVHAFLTQRRGGRSIFALNIRNRTAPTLLWKITGGVAGDDFENLGQTWSEPVLATLKGRGTGGADLPVLVFGGGYDPAQDDTYQLADSYGNSIYVVNAETGALVWEISDSGADLNISAMDNSIPADVKVIDLDEDGYPDRIYAVDVVGRIFRVDFSNSGSQTTIAGGGRLASLFATNDLGPTCDEGAPVSGVAGACQRRFYNSPDIAVMTGYPVSPYVQIGVGSGYRAHPVEVSGIEDRFFMLFDEHVLDVVASGDYSTEYGWTESNLVDVTEINVTTSEEGQSPYSAASANVQARLTASNIHGWYIEMEGEEEKVLSDAVTLGGKLVFTTYLRDSTQVTACEPDLGQGRIYVVDAFNGLPIANLNDGTILSESTITPTKDARHKDLGRLGIPTDPIVVFRETDDGKIEPMVVVSTELPLPPGLFGQNNYIKTWWINEE
ncbi:MAG: hypothetical protein B0D96_09245 [Candidatus Sedimenticola endophacoides]|nr:MAG: hypothetical protein B0D96_09245 [Candidatus Sedimenticola endophacoides]OQX40615.1 MAG: hypothetical protein B0D89_07020 [Candidatus Sedimenticola endophacoides]OQX45458.1 MAG: hypothetical protein B0D88_00325 [Candidatus Sedimenticola endophacoides]